MTELDMMTEVNLHFQDSDSQLIGSAEDEPRSAPRWSDSFAICSLADEERHLGHIVNAGDYWVAFDATHLNGEGTGFAVLGTFPEVTSAKCAVAKSCRIAPR